MSRIQQILSKAERDGTARRMGTPEPRQDAEVASAPYVPDGTFETDVRRDPPSRSRLTVSCPPRLTILAWSATAPHQEDPATRTERAMPHPCPWKRP